MLITKDSPISRVEGNRQTIPEQPQTSYPRRRGPGLLENSRCRSRLGSPGGVRLFVGANKEPPVNLSVVMITFNEEANLPRTLASVQPLVENGHGEIIVVDSGSTDRTVEIAKGFGAKVFIEEWKGFARQKNSAIDKATGDWILSLDADEEVEPGLSTEIREVIAEQFRRDTAQGISQNAGDRLREIVHSHHITGVSYDRFAFGYMIPRKNFFLGRWARHGGFYPDRKLRLFRRGAGAFEDRPVHEDVSLGWPANQLSHALVHHAYPNLSDYIEHMNRYSTLGAEMAVAKGYRGFSVIDIAARPVATFIYNYIFRLGFLDGREGLLLHLYHSVYVSWKYAKAWELTCRKESADSSLR